MHAIALALALYPGNALALAPAKVSQLGETVLLGPAYLEPPFPQSDELATALAARNHGAALKALGNVNPLDLQGPTVGDHAFLLAWELLRADRGAEAVRLVEKVRAANTAPPAYRDLTVGELLLEDGKYLEAIAAFEQVPADAVIYPRARLRAAEAHTKLEATADALAIYQELAARPDPSDGSELALMALARKAGTGSPEAYPYLRRLWSYYPRTAEGIEADKKLAAYEAKGGRYAATPGEIALRAETLMDAWRYDDAIALVVKHAGKFDKPSEASCMAWYARGRSLHKKNQMSNSAAVLEPAGDKCAGIDTDRGAKSLYLAGKAYERRKEWTAAAAAYQKIPQLYPDHSMADDGYALAGIAWQIAGDQKKAVELWEAQVRDYPDGDLGAEGFWRLAWNSYLLGDTEQAITWAEQMIWQVPVETDPVHVLAGHYWAARWRIYPDVGDPSTESPDDEAVEQGIRLLTELCSNHPTSFYALLGAQRLYELRPEALDPIRRPEKVEHGGHWTVRAAFMDEPAAQRGLALARLGLVKEALAEFDTLGADNLSPSEATLATTVLERSDPIVAHDKVHHYLLDHPPGVLGPDADRILRYAHPDTYWDLVQAAAADYSYDPRIFHALVREESSFNPRIVSHAGARGLSQLMPATGAQVAKWLGVSMSQDDFFDPAKNLAVGSRYLEYLHDYFDGNSFLAVPAYNAGEGNVGKWLKEGGERPTDEFVEAIPLRETRGYVKRVLGTYQMYRVLYDPGPVFPDWHEHNHKATRRDG